MYTPEKMILTAGPSITQLEIDYVNDAVTNWRNSNRNWYIKKFEEKFAEYIWCAYTMSTSSCTGALHVALTALWVKAGDEVLVPDITRWATASAVRYVWATPIFVDVDPKTRCISADEIEKHITSRTRAVMPVYNYGNAPEMDKIMEVARKHNLFVVEDAAPGIGTTYKWKKAGSFGDFGCFSFQWAKIMTTWEWGMLVTNNKELFERAQFLWDHWRNPDGSFRILEVGYKYKMPNIAAALGLAQLERIDEIVGRKRAILEVYKTWLTGIDWVTLNYQDEDCKVNARMSSIVIDPKIIKISRDDLRKELKERNIDTRPFFPQLSKSDAYFTKEHDGQKEYNPNAKLIAENWINLPSGHNLTQEELLYIVDVLRSLLK